MFPKPEFYGSTTVGERGQVVLPASMRKEFSIRAGDKMLVLGGMGPFGAVILVKAEVIDLALRDMSQQLAELGRALRESSAGVRGRASQGRKGKLSKGSKR